MGKFRNSKALRKSEKFTLPSTGIEAEIHGLSGSEIRKVLRTVQSSEEVDMMQDGNMLGLLERAPEEIAKLLLDMMNEPQEQEDIDGLLDLPLPDLKLITMKAMEVTFEGKNPRDFFAGWAEGMALDGFFERVSSEEEEIRNPLREETNSETSSQPREVDPEEEALLTS